MRYFPVLMSALYTPVSAARNVGLVLLHAKAIKDIASIKAELCVCEFQFKTYNMRYLPLAI